MNLEPFLMIFSIICLIGANMGANKILEGQKREEEKKK